MTDGPELLRIGIGGVVPVQWSMEKSDDGPGSLTGWASVYNVVDQQDDIVAPGAFRKTISEWRRVKRVIPLTLDHQNTAEGVIGSLAKVEDTAYGLKTTFQFSSTAKAQDARTKAREGHLNGLSIWGPIFEKSFDTMAGKSVRVLREVGLGFVGLTPMPANTDSLVLTAKDQIEFVSKPLQQCQSDGQPGWKWGDSGTCYTFTSGDEESEAGARHKAMAQAAAMGAFPGTGQKSLDFDEFTDSMQRALSISFPAAKKAAVHILLGSYQVEPATVVSVEPVAADAVKDTSAENAAADYALSIAKIGPGDDPPDGEPSDSLAGLFASLDAETTKSELDSLEAELKREST